MCGHAMRLSGARVHGVSCHLLVHQHFLFMLWQVPACVHVLCAQVVPEFMEWFANYLVVKRAAQEANYHRLYIALVDRVSDK